MRLLAEIRPVRQGSAGIARPFGDRTTRRYIGERAALPVAVHTGLLLLEPIAAVPKLPRLDLATTQPLYDSSRPVYDQRPANRSAPLLSGNRIRPHLQPANRPPVGGNADLVERLLSLGLANHNLFAGFERDMQLPVVVDIGCPIHLVSSKQHQAR